MAAPAESPNGSQTAPRAGNLARSFEVLAEVGRSLLGISLNMEERLQLTLKLATEALNSNRGSVMVADPEQSTLRIKASVGVPPEALDAVIPFGEGIAGWVAANNEPVIVHGDFQDPRFAGVDPTINSSISLPLAVEGNLFGVLNIVRPSGERFTVEDLNVASSLADLAALAMEKSRLYDALAEKEERTSHLLAAAIQAQEQERKRIAADIHDGFLQDLSAVFLKAESAKMMLARGHIDRAQAAIADIKEMVRQEVSALRDYIFEVRPPSLDEVGLAPTLKQMTQRIAQDNGLRGQFDPIGSHERLPRALETILYRTAQEALRNIVKHAKAFRFRVALERKEDEVVLLITDDGRGVSADFVENKGHYGIETMRERIELAGGRLHIGPQTAGGTEVKASIPLNQPKPQKIQAPAL
jgi:signal transduction histidine kinase